MTTELDPTRILLADEQALFREAVRGALEGEADMEVVADVRDGLAAVAEAERIRPDVAVLDAALPRCDGLKAAAMIRDRVHDCRILILSDDEDTSTLVDAFEAGANGFLTKTSGLAELIQTVRAVRRGETFVPPALLGDLLTRLIRRRRDQDDALRRASRLTRREREVLSLLARGADNITIARSLVISPQTARTHIQNVMGKLGMHSRLEVAMFVTQNGILDELTDHEPVIVPDLHPVPN
jgi:two-component system NarL family response regulator